MNWTTRNSYWIQVLAMDGAETWIETSQIEAITYDGNTTIHTKNGAAYASDYKPTAILKNTLGAPRD